MKTLLTFMLFMVITTNINSQAITLPETLISINADYLKASDFDNACNYVKKLEEVLLSYDHSKLAKLYDTNDDTYRVSFKTSEGKIIAWFNKDGKIVKTYEKYKNVRLPQSVLQAVISRYPDYNIVEDVYLLQYHGEKLETERKYEVKIKNKDNIITLKTNSLGDFI